MSFGDITRINTNIQSIRSYYTLQDNNNQIGNKLRQMSTGKRINRAEDDSAGYSIARKLESRVRGQNQALANISDAKGMLTVAEGGLRSTMDILMSMKEKTIQAANDTMDTEERDVIQNQLTELAAEINDISDGTDFNGKNLLDGTYAAAGTAGTALVFQVGAEDGDTFEVNIAASSSGALGLTAGTAAIDVSSASAAGAFLGDINTAITNLSDQLAALGDKQKRLSFKSSNLSTSVTNYEASRSLIEDADFAKQQMEMAKLQILQQTGNAALAQANAAPQSVLQLL